MPCYTVTSASIDLKNALPDVLKSALEAEGYRITVDRAGQLMAQGERGTFAWKRGEGGNVVSRYNGETAAQQAAQITRAYSAAAVQYAARRNGWTVKQTAANKYEVTRRA